MGTMQFLTKLSTELALAKKGWLAIFQMLGRAAGSYVRHLASQSLSALLHCGRLFRCVSGTPCDVIRNSALVFGYPEYLQQSDKQ